MLYVLHLSHAKCMKLESSRNRAGDKADPYVRGSEMAINVLPEVLGEGDSPIAMVMALHQPHTPKGTKTTREENSNCCRVWRGWCGFRSLFVILDLTMTVIFLSFWHLLSCSSCVEYKLWLQLWVAHLSTGVVFTPLWVHLTEGNWKHSKHWPFVKVILPIHKWI